MYVSNFTVQFPAKNRALVTPQEVELALGAEFSADLPYLPAAIMQGSDLIARECLVPKAGAVLPTLREEGIVETFRIRAGRVYREDGPLILARHPVSRINSIVVDGVELVEEDYELLQSEGHLVRLCEDRPVGWSGDKIVITYVAGWEPIPDVLKLAAIRILQEHVSASERDPLLRGETIEGIGRFDYWVNAPSASSAGARPVSSTVSAMLDPFRYMRP